jgi:hypothetical protein
VSRNGQEVIQLNLFKFSLIFATLLHYTFYTINQMTDQALVFPAVDSVGLGDRRGCDECKELLESEQWLAL